MLEHVAMPDKASGRSCKWRDDTRHLAWWAQDRVLPALLFRGSGDGFSNENHFGRALMAADIEAAAVKQLEMDRVQMNRMSINRRIHNFPDFDRAVPGIFSDRIVKSHSIQQDVMEAAIGGHVFAKHVAARFNSGVFPQPLHFGKARWNFAAIGTGGSGDAARGTA